jgi:hypothetical protein
MPAYLKVSVGWQIVFTFLPIVNFWAFYRIRKLRKYVFYVILPSIVFSIAYLSYLFDRFAPPSDSNPFYGYSPTYDFVILNPLLYATTQGIGWGLQGFAIYLVIIWSRQHNQQFDQPSTQAGL